MFPSMKTENETFANTFCCLYQVSNADDVPCTTLHFKVSPTMEASSFHIFKFSVVNNQYPNSD